MIEFFLRRRLVVNLLSLMVIGGGVWYFFNVKRDAFPEIDFDVALINTIYPGATPEEVERLITVPLEDEIQAVDGIEKVESISMEGRSMIVIQFDDNMSSREVDKRVNDLQQAVDRVEDLPATAEDPVVQEMTSDWPLINVSVAGADAETRDRFADELKNDLEAIPDVSRVLLKGDQEREIWVEVDLNKLRRYKVSLREIARAIDRNNREIPGGTVDIGSKEILVRTMGALQTAEEVGRVVVRSNDDRSLLRVRDLATVRETFEEIRIYERANGEPAIHLQVKKRRQGDSIRLADRVKGVVNQWESRAETAGLRLYTSNDVSFFVKRRLQVMRTNMAIGGFLVLVALLAFLHWRVALAAGIGVPIAICGAMVVNSAVGLSLNMITLLAFILVLGLLTDDAVVVAENAYHHLEQGEKPFQAVVNGCKEVLLPVIGAVTTTMAVFVPFFLVTGMMGKFLFAIPVVVIVALAVSLLEAFCFLPSHVLDLALLGNPGSLKPQRRWYQPALAFYERTLAWSLRHRAKFLLLLGGFLLVTVGVGSKVLRKIWFPPGAIDQFFIKVEYPDGTNLDQAAKWFAPIESELSKHPPEVLEAVITSVGTWGVEEEGPEQQLRGTQYVTAWVFLTPEDGRSVPSRTLMDEARQWLAADSNAVKFEVEEVPYGPPVGKPVYVRVRGNDFGVLQEIVGEMKTLLENTEGVFDVSDSFDGGKKEFRVFVDPGDAAYAGLDIADVAETIALAYGGSEATTLKRPDDEVKVRVRLPEGVQSDRSSLGKILVANPRGQLIPLAPMVRYEETISPPLIQRYNDRRTITVTANVDNQAITSIEANQMIQDAFADVETRWPGTDLVFGGEAEDTAESMASLGRSFSVAVLLCLLILAALFRSLVQPLLILLTVPIGMAGVVYALLLHGKPLSFMASLGVVAMVGVVVNNAVILVDLTNTLREKGLALGEAVQQAAVRRFRPIWASSLTTLLALFPTAYGIGGTEPFIQPMTLALAWGLAFAFPLTLYIIPMAYSIAADFTGWLGRRFNPFRQDLES